MNQTKIITGRIQRYPTIREQLLDLHVDGENHSIYSIFAPYDGQMIRISIELLDKEDENDRQTL